MEIIFKLDNVPAGIKGRPAHEAIQTAMRNKWNTHEIPSIQYNRNTGTVKLVFSPWIIHKGRRAEYIAGFKDLMRQLDKNIAVTVV